MKESRKISLKKGENPKQVPVQNLVKKSRKKNPKKSPGSAREEFLRESLT